MKTYKIYFEGCDVWGFDWYIANRNKTLNVGLETQRRIIDGVRGLVGRAKPWIETIESGLHLAGGRVPDRGGCACANAAGTG